MFQIFEKGKHILEVCLIYPLLSVVFLYHFEGNEKLPCSRWRVESSTPQVLAPCSNV